MNREPVLVVADIIKNCLSLNDGQIFIYNQNFKLPETSGLFIIIQYNSSQEYSSNSEFVPTESGANELISSQVREEYTINVLSRDDTARTKKEEVKMALNSNYSQNQQGLYQFSIGRLGNFTNVSELEGADVINRFALNINLLAHYSKTLATDYYDTFTNSTLTD